MATQDSATFVALVQATAGAAGGVFASFMLMPLEVAKTRIQVSRSGDTSTLATLQDICATEGVPGLFSGVGTKCTETGSKNFVYFYIYDALNHMVKKDKVSTAVKLLLGYTAGIFTTTLTMPLEVLATKLQLPENSEFGTYAVVNRVMKTDGLSGFFKGFWFNVALCINPAIQNTCFDRMKDGILGHRAKTLGPKSAALSPLEAFVLGALAKAVATVITFPMVRLKTILQAETPENEAKATSTKIQKTPSLASIKREKSTLQAFTALSIRVDLPISIQGPMLRIASLYRGMGSALFKTVLQAALLYMTKDQVERLVVVLFKITSKVLFRKNSGKVKLGAFSGRPLAS